MGLSLLWRESCTEAKSRVEERFDSSALGRFPKPLGPQLSGGLSGPIAMGSRVGRAGVENCHDVEGREQSTRALGGEGAHADDAFGLQDGDDASKVSIA